MLMHQKVRIASWVARTLSCQSAALLDAGIAAETIREETRPTTSIVPDAEVRKMFVFITGPCHRVLHGLGGEQLTGGD